MSEWKEDKSPLHVYDYGETKTHGEWTLSVQHRRKFKPLNEFVDTMLTAREKEVLDTRFGVDGEDPREARRKREELEDRYPYHWSVHQKEFDSNSFFLTHFGGQAETIEQAKALAEESVGHASRLFRDLSVFMRDRSK